MADNVITLNKKEQKDPEKKVEGFLTKNRKLFIILIAAVVVAAAAVCIYVGVKDSTTKKGLAAVDTIEYTLTKDSSSLSEEELSAREDAALKDLESYSAKSGVVGVRANMLCADIYFDRKDYADAMEKYVKAAEAGKKSYTAPMCYYNAAVCAEELDDNKNAAMYYEIASNAEDFLLVTHTLVSLGRVEEALGDYQAAAKAYQKLVDEYSSDDWTDVAHSRLIDLKAKGLIE